MMIATVGRARFGEHTTDLLPSIANERFTMLE
jgi:hypothetical protein